MKIGIIGAGAMGGLFGGQIAHNGHDVHLFDIDEKIINEVSTNGLTIEVNERDSITVTPNATTFDVDDIRLDFTFLFVKSQYTLDAISQYSNVISNSDNIITLQNGLSNIYMLRDNLDESKVYGGYTRNGANTVDLGRIKLMGKGKTVIGGNDIATSKRISELLSTSGLKAESVNDPLPHIWDKQFVNVGIKPVAALTELQHGGMFASQEAKTIMSKLINEAVVVARSKGVEIISNDPVNDTISIISTEEKRNKKSSMLEDVENKRKTEIKFINGSIVDFGQEEGINTPYNWMATKLVKAKEQSYLQ